jgi:hypothetical protein
MRKRYLYTILFVLLGFLVLSSYPYSEEPQSISGVEIKLVKPSPSLEVYPLDRSSEYILTKGILTSKIKEEVWYQCGKKVPHEEWYDRASELAEACLYSARPRGIDAVGQLATWQQESRLDPCALGPYPRKWGIRKGLLKKKCTLSYTKEEVKKVVEDPRFKASFRSADLGLGQQLHPWYTHGATLDELLSIAGAEVTAKELEERGKRWRTDEPWITWPGHKSKARKRKIEWWVYKVMEIDFLKK